MNTKAKRRLTEAEFEAVRPFLSISEERIAAAKAALVPGETLQKIADEYGWSRQAVNDCVNNVWRTYERYQESQRATTSAGAQLPPGWEQVTLIAPKPLIAKFRSMIAEASPNGSVQTTAKKPAAKKVKAQPAAKKAAPKKPTAKATLKKTAGKEPVKAPAKAAKKKIAPKPRSK